MSTTVNVGWLKDNNGEKFAPKTLSSQIVTNEGTLFAEEIQEKIDNIDVGIEITKAEYEALGDSVLTDGKTYFITDVNNDISVPVIKNAADIIYDNTESAIEASNVQDAIDYLVSNDSNIQTQINDINTNIESCFQSVSDGKVLIASAITDKNIPTDATATFAQMAENIASLKLGSGTAQKSHVLSPYTFTNADGVEYTGEMTDNGAVSKTITPSTSSQSYTIPKGYHDGTGKVTVNAAPTSLINGDATAANVLSGKTFFSDSYTAKTGTMTNNGAKTASLNCGDSYTIPAGYHNGSGKVTANSLASQTSATAAAAQIAKGYTAWVNGKKITGTRAQSTITSSTVMCTSLNGQQTVTKTISYGATSATVPTVTITSMKSTVDKAQSTLEYGISDVTKTNFKITLKNGQAGNGYNANTVTAGWKAVGEFL